MQEFCSKSLAIDFALKFFNCHLEHPLGVIVVKAQTQAKT